MKSGERFVGLFRLCKGVNSAGMWTPGKSLESAARSFLYPQNCKHAFEFISLTPTGLMQI